MWFKRKSTEYAQLFHKLERQLNTLRSEHEEEKARNHRNLLEYAELGEKMRRLYLRIARRQKIDSETPSSNDEPVQEESPELSAKATREAIEQNMEPF